MTSRQNELDAHSYAELKSHFRLLSTPARLRARTAFRALHEKLAWGILLQRRLARQTRLCLALSYENKKIVSLLVSC